MSPIFEHDHRMSEHEFVCAQHATCVTWFGFMVMQFTYVFTHSHVYIHVEHLVRQPTDAYHMVGYGQMFAHQLVRTQQVSDTTTVGLAQGTHNDHQLDIVQLTALPQHSESSYVVDSEDD